MATTDSIIRNIKAAGGLSPKELQAKEDAYMGQRNAAIAPLEKSILEGAEQRKQILSTPVERPAKPYLQALPQAPSQQFRSPAEAMMSGGPILAALGSMFTRRPAVAMMNAFASGTKAFHAGDSARMEQERKNWKDALDQTVAQNATEMQAYSAALQDANFSMADRQAQLMGIAASNRDEQMLASLRTGNLDSAYQLILGRQKAASELANLAMEADQQAAQFAETQRHHQAMENKGSGVGGFKVDNRWDAGQALLQLDPASPQYAAIYNELGAVKETFNPTTGQIEKNYPNMSAYPRPTYGQSSAPPGQSPAIPSMPAPSRSPAARERMVVNDAPIMAPSSAPVASGSANANEAPIGGGIVVSGTPRLSDTERQGLTAARTEALSLVKSLKDYANEFSNADAWERIKTGGGASTQLSNKYNIGAMLAKGEALFKLGVLAGPDMDIVRGVLTDPSTLASAFTTADGVKNQVNSLVDNIAFKLNTYESLLNQKPTSFSVVGAGFTPAGNGADDDVIVDGNSLSGFH